jgi:hypothetical protein
MKTLASANQALINQSKPGSEKEPTNIQRRALIGGALVALLSSPGRVMAQGKAPDHRREDRSVPKDPFVLLLNGLYHPVAAGTGPDLGQTNRLTECQAGISLRRRMGPPCSAAHEWSARAWRLSWGLVGT